MEQIEKDFKNIYGGAPRAAVKEFTKPQDMKKEDELDENDIMNVVGGLNYGVSVEYQSANSDAFSEERLDRERETARMLGELDANNHVNHQRNR